MIIDKQTLFSDEQAITADAASTNVYDTGSTADVGPGNPIQVFAQIMEAFNNLTSLDIKLQTSTDEAFSSPITLQTVSMLLAALTAGAKVSLSTLPEGCKRYLRLYYDVTGTDPTTGKITAGLVLDRQANTPTADAI